MASVLRLALTQTMVSPEFPIPVHELDAAGRRFRFPIRVAWMRGAFEGTDVVPPGPDGELDVRVSKSGADAVVRGTLAAELQVPCARCLEPARVDVREELSALAVTSDGLEEPSADDEEPERGVDDGADVLRYDGETLVLDDLVRDELLLGIPMIPLCSESCPGIRPKPTAGSSSADIDPRLLPLLALKSKT